MVRNKLCWDANNAVGLSKQGKSGWTWNLVSEVSLRYLRPIVPFSGSVSSDDAKGLLSMYRTKVFKQEPFIQNNQGLRKGYQPQSSASADNPYLDLDYSGYHKNLIQQ